MCNLDLLRTTLLVCLLIGQGWMSSTTTTSVSTFSGTGFSVTSTTTSSMNMTNNSSEINASTATSAITTSSTTTTTTKPPFDIQHNLALALFTLTMTVGLDNSSNICYQNTNLTKDELLNKLSAYFSNFSFGFYLQPNDNSGQDQISFTLSVQFLFKNDSWTLEDQIVMALLKISNSGDFIVPNYNMTLDAIEEFITMTMDVCNAQNICPLGFTCVPNGCQHMCRSKDCSNHGKCYTSVDVNSSVTTLCQCDSKFSTEYLGDNCQYSRHGRLEIIAIIAGVLGGACLIFIVVIIIMCVLYSRRKSSSNYNLPGASYTNNAYDNAHEK